VGEVHWDYVLRNYLEIVGKVGVEVEGRGSVVVRCATLPGIVGGGARDWEIVEGVLGAVEESGWEESFDHVICEGSGANYRRARGRWHLRTLTTMSVRAIAGVLLCQDAGKEWGGARRESGARAAQERTRLRAANGKRQTANGKRQTTCRATAHNASPLCSHCMSGLTLYVASLRNSRLQRGGHNRDGQGGSHELLGGGVWVCHAGG